MNKITGLSLADCSRTQHVKRWHIVDMKKEQSVAEHSFMVALISREILRLADEKAAAPKSDHIHYNDFIQETLEYSLTHDLAEVITGDIPSPVKARLGNAVDWLEGDIDPKKPAVTPFVKNVVKLADYIEAAHHLKKYGYESPAKTRTVKVLNDKARYHASLMADEYGEWFWREIPSDITLDLGCNKLSIVEDVCAT